ncbi:MAG: ATP-dependent Clp protease adapter ClpS [Pseudomonas sp.]|jgi:ATP-dependent Clp protease adaptor protein ClpS|nr:ATP-dependent Clp protease adapter ClpS [Pseudomonas sp.]
MTVNPANPDYFEQDNDDVAIAPARPVLQPPPMYRVLMLNDDFTPMDFVVEVLERFFAMTREQSTQTMLAVHNQGFAMCGVFTRDVAETKAQQVSQYARDCNHPLLCEVEKDV